MSILPRQWIRSAARGARFALALGLLALLAAPFASAAESTFELQPMSPDLRDKASLQRGMRLYMNYCVGCHSLKFQRYERTADDLASRTRWRSTT